jgi:beta-mannosidase
LTRSVMSKSCVFLPNISFGVERDLTGIVRLQEGKEVLYASNMFQTYRIPVKEFGKGEHSLTLTFPSAWYEAKRIEAAEMEKNLPENKDPVTGEQKKLSFWNGNSSRLYVRKAQYGWGWDWGPVVMTVGPWSECFR